MLRHFPSTSGRCVSFRKQPADVGRRVRADGLQDKSPPPRGVRPGASYSFSAFVRYYATACRHLLSHGATARSRHAVHPVKGMQGFVLFFHLMFINNNVPIRQYDSMPMEIATSSVFVRYECSVVGRGGSRTALTGAVIMEQAGSTVGAGSKPARCDNDYILLILGGFGTRPYEVGYLDSIFSNFTLPPSVPNHTYLLRRPPFG